MNTRYLDRADFKAIAEILSHLPSPEALRLAKKICALERFRGDETVRKCLERLEGASSKSQEEKW